MKTLAIMAAGLGSRYGGLKQLDTIDSEGNTIVDYSIYDAIQAGFNNVVFIIRKELHASFIERFSHLDSATLKISYVFQQTTDVPDGFETITRKKPWGTGQALLTLRHTVKNNFALINADDFYGKDAFQVLHDLLFKSESDTVYFMVGYKLKNTLSPFGAVSRGQCYVNETNILQEVIERTKIERKGQNIAYFDTDEESTILDDNTLVSMNFWGFTPSIFEFGESLFKEFLTKSGNNPSNEFYIPSIVNALVENKTVSVKVLSTDSKWYGITYKEDKEQIVNAVKAMKSTRAYPERLWQSNIIQSIFNKFNHKDDYNDYLALTDGHINDTYKIETLSGNDFVLQRINSNIFPNVDELINNKVAVSKHLKEHSNYNVSEFKDANESDYLVRGSKGNSWSLCTFIKGTTTYLIPKDEQMARQAGVLLGDFHKSMKGYDVTSLSEIIPDFHNLTHRTQQFKDALKTCDKNTIKEVQDLIDLIQHLGSDAEYLDNLKSSGELQLRVTHNDAKLSNMLFNKNTGEAVAMIDFDTIMPGIIHYDIGDAIRSICSITNEDEEDMSKVDFNIDYYKAFMEGFLSIMNSQLSDIEKQTLPLAIKYMLYEQSLRFLTDYLNGNIYYKVYYPEHNLIRTKNQLKLLEIVNEQFERIEEITREILTRV